MGKYIRVHVEFWFPKCLERECDDRDEKDRWNRARFPLFPPPKDKRLKMCSARGSKRI